MSGDKGAHSSAREAPPALNELCHHKCVSPASQELPCEISEQSTTLQITLAWSQDSTIDSQYLESLSGATQSICVEFVKI